MKLFLSEIGESVSTKKVDISEHRKEIVSGLNLVDADLDLSFYIAGETVVLKFTGTFTVDSLCDRCIEPVEITVDINESYYVFPEDSKKDVDYYYSGDSIELIEYIRDIVIMNMPDKILCSEDCKGLCANCGNNLNDRDCGCSNGE